MIELLTALSLSAIILVTLYPMIYSSVKEWKSMRSRSEKVQTVRAAMEAIEADLENAVPFAVKNFQGAENRLSFYTLMALEDSSEEAARRAVARVEYVWEDDGSGKKQLRRSWMAFVPEPHNGLLQGNDTFPSSISDFALSYASYDPARMHTSWKQSWNQKKAPDSVSVALTLEASGGDDALSLQQIIRIPRGS